MSQYNLGNAQNNILFRLTENRITQLKLAIREYLVCYDDGGEIAGQRQFWLESAVNEKHPTELTDAAYWYSNLIRISALENLIKRYLQEEYGECRTCESDTLKDSLDLSTYHNQPRMWDEND